MGSVLESMPPGAHVAVVRLRSLGDCVLTTPALELLHGFRPDLRVAVVVEDRFRAVFEDHPAVAEILRPALAPLRRFRPRLCLNLHGGTRSGWLTALSGAPVRAGFAHHRCRMAYNLPIPRAQEILGEERKVHTAEHLASAMFFLGVPPVPVPRACLSAAPGPRTIPYAVIHPAAATPEKTWPAAGFQALAEHLHATGIEPVFIAGAGDDLSPFSTWRVICGAPLAEVKALLAGALLFVGNDSGPAHMAAAFGLPVVVLFGPSDPVIWAPWRTTAEVLTSPAGIASISPERVIQAIDRLRVPV